MRVSSTKYFRAIVFSLVFAASLQANAQDSLALYTEHNPPFTFLNPGSETPVGPAAVIVSAIMEQTKTPYSMKILPWRRAYRLTLSEPNTCLFLTYRTPEREPLFSWVGPIIMGEWAIYKRHDSDIEINSLEDLRNYAVVGMAGSADALSLEAALGKSILQTASGELAVQMLYRGRADLWISDTRGSVASANAMGLPTPKIAYLWRTSDLSLACSKTTSPALIEALNQANQNLDEFKQGLLDNMVRRPQ